MMAAKHLSVERLLCFCGSMSLHPRGFIEPLRVFSRTGHEWGAQLPAITAALQALVRLSEHIADTDGEAVFRQACAMGLEGIVAKRRDCRYRSGRSREWLTVKNRAHPAFERAMLIALSKHTSRSR
jgi:ATP-dependent DNA ligase